MTYARAAILIAMFVSLTTSGEGAPDLKVLIIDGQNNHAIWPKTTMMMRSYLRQAERFTVDIARTHFTWQGDDLLSKFPLQDGQDYVPTPLPRIDPEFRPNFEAYDVVISNFGYDAAPWPEETRTALEVYMRKGGGLVVVHAANNSFGDWKEFNRMIGLGGWGGRTEKQGPYVYLNPTGETVRDDAPGPGGQHGSEHEFQIVVRDSHHPITRDMPRVWRHAQDELYGLLRGPAEGMTILATAFSDESRGGTGRHEPMIMTVQYHRGRIFHTPMGHGDYSQECVGFITTFVRGAEWAATGEVQPVDLPADFPDADRSRRRRFDER